MDAIYHGLLIGIGIAITPVFLVIFGLIFLFLISIILFTISKIFQK